MFYCMPSALQNVTPTFVHDNNSLLNKPPLSNKRLFYDYSTLKKR